MSKTREWSSGAYVIRPRELLKLWKLMEDELGNVTSSAECSDGIERDFDSWEDLDCYDNSSRKQIKELSLWARSADFRKSASVHFYADKGSRVFVSIECPEREILHVKNSINDILAEMRHSILTLFSGKGLVAISSLYFVVSWATTVGLSYFLLYGSTFPFEGQMLVSSDSWKYSLAAAIIGGLAIVPVGVLLHRVYRKLLPQMYFATGLGESRYESWKTGWRIALGLTSTLLVTILGGTIVNFMWFSS